MRRNVPTPPNKSSAMSDLDLLQKKIKELGIGRVLVLVDEQVDKLFPHHLYTLETNIPCEKIIIPAGEGSKSIAQASRIWQQMLQWQMDKDCAVLNFGGGMVCDLGGFVAATYKRGIACINYPTTLLAMIDAAHGGKTAIDLDGVKNCVGVVRQPAFVMPANTQFLRTLPERELRSGFGELIKYALISSKPLFEELYTMDTLTAEAIQPEWIQHCIDFKNRIVEIDPDDRRERRVLNFGHTVGHALESLFAQKGQPLAHGEAVAIGILYESRMANQAGMLPKEDLSRIESLVSKHFPLPVLSAEDKARINGFMKQDKKNNQGKINIVMLKRIGEACGPSEDDGFGKSPISF